MTQTKPLCTASEAYRTARVAMGTTMMRNAPIYRGGVRGGGPAPVGGVEVEESVHSGPRPIGGHISTRCNVSHPGGLHRPSNALDDRIVMRDEIVIAMVREAHELTDVVEF